jgi:hypothetical protein
MTRQTTLRFPPEASAALRSTCRLAQLEKADAIRAALQLYGDLLDLAQSKFLVFVRDGNGKRWPFSPYEQFNYPALAAARKRLGMERRAHAVDFIVSAAAVTEIDRIQARGALKARTDVVRAALAAYHALLLVSVCAGDKILVHSPSGNETTIELGFSIREQITNFPGPLRPPTGSPTAGTSPSQMPHG